MEFNISCRKFSPICILSILPSVNIEFNVASAEYPKGATVKGIICDQLLLVIASIHNKVFSL